MASVSTDVQKEFDQKTLMVKTLNKLEMKGKQIIYEKVIDNTMCSGENLNACLLGSRTGQKRTLHHFYSTYY